MEEQGRSERLKRLVAVQRHMERLTESELAETTKTRNEVTMSMERVIDAIGSMDPVHMVFCEHYAERFGRLTNKDKQLAGVQSLLETQMLKERTKAERLEEHMREAEEQEIRELDDNAIYEVIDQQFAKSTPASSKVQKP
jgi:hypothetical protein